MEQRVDELSMAMKDSEKHQKNQNSEIERLRQENKSQKGNIKEAEDQVRRTEETIERLKKIKQEKDVAIGDIEESSREQEWIVFSYLFKQQKMPDSPLNFWFFSLFHILYQARAKSYYSNTHICEQATGGGVYNIGIRCGFNTGIECGYNTKNSKKILCGND